MAGQQLVLLILVACTLLSVASATARWAGDPSLRAAAATRRLQRYGRDECGAPAMPNIQEALDLKCDACKVALFLTRDFLKKSGAETKVEDVVAFFCSALKIEDKNVCSDIVIEFGDFLLYLVENEALTGEFACGVLDACPKADYPKWNVTFSRPKPPVNPYPPVSEDNKIYVLHITDVHVDELYTEGLDTACGEPICCRPPNKPGKPGSQAGKWGDYNCDSPTILYENMLDFIAANFQKKLAYAVFTGDVPAHNVWDIDRKQELDTIDIVTKQFHKRLPGLQLFPAVGNHEAVPVNEFVTRDIKGEFDMGWLYDRLALRWSTWLPEEAVNQTRFAGYYSALTPDGVRMISLNTNLGCNDQDWWLKIPSAETADPDNMMHWFEETLDKAEQAGEMVYIVQHIKGEPGCGADYWRNYWNILHRYENIILANFAGHTHDDRFAVTYAPDADGAALRPMLATWFAGSVTPDANENPGFRIWEIDAKTKGIIDYQQWALNLTDANLTGEPKWYLEYTARSGYGLPDMSPASWAKLTQQIAGSTGTADLYNLRKGKQFPQPACDAKCAYETSCETVIAPADFAGDACKTWVRNGGPAVIHGLEEEKGREHVHI
mmetsp:Transcript_7707/g.19458  ORF Transcript_7707/g.19458 Transcript_7707/m.19458 type:complete len:608 (-) Transcript_7707:1788-3611(-)